MRALLLGYPAVAGAMARRHIVYNRQMDQIEERERLGRAFVLRPPEDLRIGRTEKNPDELERVYQIGRETAGEAADRIRRFLLADTAEERML